MDSVTLLLRAALVIVFSTAAVAKLRDLQGSRDTVFEFGIPRGAADVGGTLLPIAESACAVALLLQPTARWGAVGCLLLLALFSAGVGYALAQGRAPDCNCFGQVHSEQIGPRTLARNVFLALVAAVAVWKAPGSSFSSWTTNRSAAEALTSAAVLAAGLLTVATLHYRQLARSSPRTGAATGSGSNERGGLPVGSPAPDFELPDLEGSPITLNSLTERGLPVILVFASQSCAPCAALLPELARWNGALGHNLTVAVVESLVGDRDLLAQQVQAVGDLLTVTEPDRDLAILYEVEATPTGIAIDAGGRIMAPPARGAGAIEELVRATLRRGQPEARSAA